jgi:hypothetical protein
MKSLNMTKWHKGPPPSIGWWPASLCQDKNSLRWWNGEYWSRAVKSNFSMSLVIKYAKMRAPFQSTIKWTHRPSTWPERSKT